MKRRLTWLLVILLMLTMSACTGSMGDVNDKQVVGEGDAGSAAISEATTGESDQQETTTTEEEPADDVALAETVVYDNNGIKVTAKGLDFDDFMGPSIVVLIENNSDKNIMVQSKTCSVNGFMTETIFSSDIAAGKKANDTITFQQSSLDAAGITLIRDIEFSLSISDGDTWETIDDSDPIMLTTTADPSFVQEYDDSGFVITENNGIKVVAKKLNSSDSFWGSDLCLYIENNSDQDITIQSRDVSINGFMVNPIFSCDITKGKKAIDSITFLESDLTDNGVTDITELELKLNIFNMESWATIEETDSIKISFE